MSKIDNFPYPTPITAKIRGVPFGIDPWCRVRREMKGWANSRDIIFQEFQPIWSRYLKVRETDGQTTCLGCTRYAVLRAVKIVRAAIHRPRLAGFTDIERVSLWGCSYFDAFCVYSVSQKKSPLRTCGNISKTAGNFSTKFYVPIMHSYLRYTTNFYSNICKFDEIMPY